MHLSEGPYQNIDVSKIQGVKDRGSSKITIAPTYPIVVTTNWRLIDGNARVIGAIKRGDKTILANVIKEPFDGVPKK
jgi:hypothetical protein